MIGKVMNDAFVMASEESGDTPHTQADISEELAKLKRDHKALDAQVGSLIDWMHATTGDIVRLKSRGTRLGKVTIVVQILLLITIFYSIATG